MKQTKFYGTPQAFSEDLLSIAHPGQSNSKFRYGYEGILEVLPMIDKDSEKWEIQTAQQLLGQLAKGLSYAEWVDFEIPTHNIMHRTIIAITPPTITPEGLQSGAEILVGHWGRNFETMIHKHEAGFNHEEMISGGMTETSYRLVDPVSNTVRPVDMHYFSAGAVMTSGFRSPLGDVRIHSVKAIVPSATLHFFPERVATNQEGVYRAEYFETVHNLTAADVVPIRFPDYLNLRPGSVILVRSENAPYFGDHYEVIGVGLEEQPHGHRLRKTVITAPESARLLNSYTPENGMVILQLKPDAVKKFSTFHNL